MNGLTVAVTTYIIAIVISFFVAGLIQLMGMILTRFAKETETQTAAMIEPSLDDTSSSDATVAAAVVIAIAKNVA
jgi:hypothetical protein